jgi:hypothetical protein
VEGYIAVLSTLSLLSGDVQSSAQRHFYSGVYYLALFLVELREHMANITAFCQAKQS